MLSSMRLVLPEPSMALITQMSDPTVLSQITGPVNAIAPAVGE
jgi:hypothetical protein